MLTREVALHSLLELAADSAGLTPLELGARVLRITKALVPCQGVALLAPRHRDCVCLRHESNGERIEPEVLPREGSRFVRLLGRMAHPLVTADISGEPRTLAQDVFPGVSRGPAVFVPFAMRDTAHGYLATYRGPGQAPFDRDEVRVLTLIATVGALALDNRRLAQDLHRLAVTDELTQVYNYRFLKSALRRELKRAARFGQHLSVVMIDVDNLKTYNDANGHLRGSMLLKDLAGLCAEQVRSFDVLAKYGGDEFTIILPQTNMEGACVVAERVRAAVAQHAFALAPRGSMTVSLGVATFPYDGTDPTSLLQAADRALYRAKRSGRNRVEQVCERAA